MIDTGASSSSSVGNSSDGAITLPPSPPPVSATSPLETRPSTADGAPEGASPAGSRAGLLMGALFVILVLTLGFFLASFAARNTDLWLHLATGRALVEGKYQFGVDPFAYTTEGVYWVNNTWLF